jgi:hypothetical protein
MYRLRNGEIAVRGSIRRSAEGLRRLHKKHTRKVAVPDAVPQQPHLPCVILRALSCVILVVALTAVIYFAALVLNGPIKVFPRSLG